MSPEVRDRIDAARRAVADTRLAVAESRRLMEEARRLLAQAPPLDRNASEAIVRHPRDQEDRWMGVQP
jgi:hypothetical protein